jgi:hypothetical protein
VRSERGQTTVEWVGLVLVVSLTLGALTAVAARVDGRPLGSLLARALACSARGGCDDGDEALRSAYGERTAALVRAHAPGIAYEPDTYTLPVDYRACRSHRCSDAPDDRDLEVSRSARGGYPATAFTRVVRRGGETFVQYWLYYPDSTTTALGARRLWGEHPPIRLATRAVTGSSSYPGAHRDDWEGYQMRIDGRGRVLARATSHHHYQSCKQRRCRGTWLPATGWTRVSRGSHAGHLPLRSRLTGVRVSPRPPFVGGRYRYEPRYPGVDLRERTTPAEGLRLVPLETLRGRHDITFAVTPPWRKRAYRDPLTGSTS